MKAFKKALTLVFAMIVVFSLAACKKEDATAKSTAPAATTGTEAANAEDAVKPEEGAKLLVWESREQRPFVEEKLNEFKEKYKVDFEFGEMAAPDSVDKIKTDGPAGLGADVFVFPHDRLGGAVNAGLLLPNDVFEKQTKEEIMAPAVSAASSKGTLYGFPKEIETYALFYNKGLVPTPPKTLDDVRAFAKTFNNAAEKKYAYVFDIGNFYFNYGYFTTLGGYVFGQEGTDPNDIGLNKPEAVESMTIFQGLKTDVLPLKSSDLNADIMTDMFTKGTAAMMVDGPWRVGAVKGKVDFAIAKLPELQPGKPMKSFSGVKAWYVSSYTKFPNAAKLFARFASTKEALVKNNQMTGALPARNDTKEAPEIANNPMVLGFLEQFDNSTPMPSIPEMNQVWGPAGGALGAIWNDGKDVKGELDNAVTQIQTAIKAGQ